VILRIPHRLVIVSVLLLALVHGGLYASFMPPWGLIDEEQHLHYVQYVTEQQAIPHVGQTTLSPEILESAFSTGRREHFHWPAPASLDPKDWGLEGQSYEGYQPPLYYLLLAPLYGALSGDILTKLYTLRWVSVGLSLLTLVFVYRIGRRLFIHEPVLPYLLCVLLAVMPERTASIARVNNDIALELFATALIWVCTQAVLDGMSSRRSRLIGLLLGLSLLAKTTAAVVLLAPVAATFWANRRSSQILRNILWATGIAAALAATWMLRNFIVYGDPTGFGSFQKITSFAPPVVTWWAIGSAVWDLFRHFWLVWWKGGRAGGNWLLTGFDLLLVIASAISLIGLVRSARLEHRDSPRLQVMLMYGLAVWACAAAVLVTYLSGGIPVVQGRLFLPVVAPAVILYGWGLWYAPFGKSILVATIVLLIVFDALSLFGNLLPYHYYWSIFAAGHAPQPSAVATLGQRWALFYPRLLADKPQGLQPVLLWLVPCYAALLGITGVAVSRHMCVERNGKRRQ
jgi:4-amino-4-deoxy-L-arabinose transferase-like glycosyltransferase